MEGVTQVYRHQGSDASPVEYCGLASFNSGPEVSAERIEASETPPLIRFLKIPVTG